MDNLVFLFILFFFPMVAVSLLIMDAVILWYNNRKDRKYIERNPLVMQPDEYVRYVRERDRRR